MNRVLAGIQAGIVTLAFVLLVVSGYLTGGTFVLVVPTWSILIASLIAFARYVMDKENPFMIAATVVVFGLLCLTVSLITNAYDAPNVFSVMALSITSGLALGASWSMVIIEPKAGKKKG